MTPAENDLQQIEITIKQAKKKVAKADALARLRENADFKAVVDEGYFRDESVRLVLLKGHPNVAQRPDMAASVENDIAAIGTFYQYLVSINAEGNQALQGIQNAQEAREEILAEDAD